VAERGGVQRTGWDVRHCARHRRPVALNPHRHRIRLDAVDEVDRAVDGIDHPGEPTVVDARRAALLLTEDAFARSKFGQSVAQQPLGVGVDAAESPKTSARRRRTKSAASVANRSATERSRTGSVSLSATRVSQHKCR
jgi:hypothetical protein